jgi:hypothetical protein
MTFSRPIQWDHSHVDPTWLDGTFKKSLEQHTAEHISEPPSATPSRRRGSPATSRRPWKKFI